MLGELGFTFLNRISLLWLIVLSLGTELLYSFCTYHFNIMLWELQMQNEGVFHLVMRFVYN
jgi:hypothetical protein